MSVSAPVPQKGSTIVYTWDEEREREASACVFLARSLENRDVINIFHHPKLLTQAEGAGYDPAILCKQYDCP